MRKLTGSCLCGKVKIEVPDEFEFIGNCHCTECRKFSGSDYAAVGGLASDKFAFTAGEEFVTYYAKTEETDVAFCSCCGTSLFSRKNQGKKHNIRLGILDDVPSQSPNFHIFTTSKSPWYEIGDDFPQFEARPPVK